MLILTFYFTLIYLPNVVPLEINLEETAAFPELPNGRNVQSLEVLPSNYLDLLDSLDLEQEQHQMVSLLRYGEAPIELKDQSNLVFQEDIPLLLNSEVIHTFFLLEFSEISKDIATNVLSKETDTLISHLEKYLLIYKILPFLASKDIIDISTGIQESKNLLSEGECLLAVKKLNDLEDTENQMFFKLLKKYNLLSNYENIKNIRTTLEISNINEVDFSTQTEVNEIQIANEKIFLETNPEYYRSIFEFLKQRREIFLENGIQSKELDDLVLIAEQLTAEEKIDTEILRAIVKTLQESNTWDTTQKDIFLRNFNIGNQNIVAVTPYSNGTTRENTVEDNNFKESYDYTPISQTNGSVRIPVLMYHQIAQAPKGSSSFVQGLYVDPDVFEKQIAYLVRNNYKILSSQEFFDILRKGENPEQKSVMITFDDGTSSQYANGYPILKKYKQTGVFFIPSARSSITTAQLKDMSDNGMDIQSHTATHMNLPKVTDTSVLSAELLGSKYSLQARTGKNVIAVAYPGCVADEKVFSVAATGYSLGFSCGRKIDHYYNNRLSLSRIHVFNDMDSFIKLLSGIN